MRFLWRTQADICIKHSFKFAHSRRLLLIEVTKQTFANYEKNCFFYEKWASLINGVLFNFCLLLSPTGNFYTTPSGLCSLRFIKFFDLGGKVNQTFSGSGFHLFGENRIKYIYLSRYAQFLPLFINLHFFYIS